ncbi:MAG TPA: acyltransferase [Gammaproteobacteria bacterium]|nr:acyltransferase [Gammaproteobacteria bacterium]
MKINRNSNNFDFLRLLFSVIVAIVHTSTLTGLGSLTEINRYASSEVAVDSFFIISGFLIFMSYESSSSIKSYTSKRVRRIFPGYITVILFCSIFFYFISSKEFLEYFNIETLKYIFFNVLTLNFIQPSLPGVFENNLLHIVNGSLWTIKVEVMFYILVPFIAYLISKSRKVYILAGIYILSVIYSLLMLWLYSKYDMEIFLRLERQLPGQLAFFISGAGIYYFYDFFYKKYLLLVIAASLIIIIHMNVIDLFILYPVSLAIIVIYVANIFKYLGHFGRFGDLSFGVYIWHFPIIQVFVYYNLFSSPVTGIIMLSVSILIVSYLSWHLVEKRSLYKSSYYIASEKKRPG